jgi:hypothetical protein
VFGRTIYLSSVTETATATDTILSGFLWNVIDDTQTPSWVLISNTQTPGWGTIDNTQTPNWTVIGTVN